MKTTTWARVASAVLSAGMLAAGCGSCPPVKAPTAAATDPKQITDVISIQVQEYRSTYEARNVEAATSLYSPSDDVAVTTQGRTVLGQAAVSGHVGAFLGAQTDIKLRISDLKVARMSQEAASATAKLHRTYGDGAQTFDDQGTLSLIYRKEGDAWKIVAEHYSYSSVK